MQTVESGLDDHLASRVCCVPYSRHSFSRCVCVCVLVCPARVSVLGTVLGVQLGDHRECVGIGSL